MNISSSPFTPDQHVILDHGTGARLSRDLIGRITSILGDVYLGEMEDSAILPPFGGRLAMTTDSFVIDPFIFGNGDIGKVAVCGTVNDLAVMGARPLYLTLSLILETGLPLTDLDRVMTSIRDCAKAAGVKIVAGDTKVVGRGEADKIFINTTGIGVLEREPLRMASVRPGDRIIIISGWLGNHSIHLLSLREGLGFETRVLSDCAPLNHIVNSILEAGGEGVRSIRDVTRGGLSGVLHEYAQKSDRTVRFRRGDLPVQAETLMATDMLGVDVLHLANEGCLALFVAPDAVDAVLAALKKHPECSAARCIGEVLEKSGGLVEMVESDGTVSVQEELIGAELPRLC